jgi:hypothetical protein
MGPIVRPIGKKWIGAQRSVCCKTVALQKANYCLSTNSSSAAKSQSKFDGGGSTSQHEELTPITEQELLVNDADDSEKGPQYRSP